MGYCRFTHLSSAGHELPQQFPETGWSAPLLAELKAELAELPPSVCPGPSGDGDVDMRDAWPYADVLQPGDRGLLLAGAWSRGEVRPVGGEVPVLARASWEWTLDSERGSSPGANLSFSSWTASSAASSASTRATRSRQMLPFGPGTGLGCVRSAQPHPCMDGGTRMSWYYGMQASPLLSLATSGCTAGSAAPGGTEHALAGPAICNSF